MAQEVITGAIAIIRVNGLAIGKMKGIRITENLQRVEVRGLGRLTPDEMPATSWSGTLTCDFYNIDFSQSQIPNAIVRAVQTVNEFEESVTLQDIGIQIDIYKRVPVAGSPGNGVIQGEEKPYAIIRGLFLDSEGFDINESQVSGRNQSFKYLDPIIFPQ